jgi:hypothetical protein
MNVLTLLCSLYYTQSQVERRYQLTCLHAATTRAMKQKVIVLSFYAGIVS